MLMLLKYMKHPARKLEKYYLVKILLITQIQKGPPLMKCSHFGDQKLLLRQTQIFLKKHVLEVSSPLIKCSPDCNDYLTRGTEEAIHSAYGI